MRYHGNKGRENELPLQAIIFVGHDRFLTFYCVAMLCIIMPSDLINITL